MKGIFNDVIISNTDQEYYDKYFNKIFENSELYLGISFTKRRRMVIYQCYFKYKKKIQNLIKQDVAIKDNSGLVEFNLGILPHGAEIEIAFGILATSSIPEASILVAQTNPAVGYRLQPPLPKPVKSLKNGDRWKGKFKYKVQ